MLTLLVEDGACRGLFPFTMTRVVADLRIGIDTVAEKWRAALAPFGREVQLRAVAELAPLYPELPPLQGDCLLINSGYLPLGLDLEALLKLSPGQGLLLGERWVAACVAAEWLKDQPRAINFGLLTEQVSFQPLGAEPGQVVELSRPWDLFVHNGRVLRDDFQRLTQGRTSAPLTDPHAAVYAPENIFLEPGATVTAAVLDARKGPIYIGRGVDIQPGAVVVGAHAFLEQAVVNAGAKLRGDSTIGPWCKVGGEVSNSIFWGYSNKAHDGFVGNSVIGAWCNLGADTNTSNLKNNYNPVKVYDPRSGQLEPSGQLFCGLLMGDHAKAGINTMFNTATVVGPCANVFGAGFPPKYIPPFSWGGFPGAEQFELKKAYEMMARVMARRQVELCDADRQLYALLHQQAAQNFPQP